MFDKVKRILGPRPIQPTLFQRPVRIQSVVLEQEDPLADAIRDTELSNTSTSDVVTGAPTGSFQTQKEAPQDIAPTGGSLGQNVDECQPQESPSIAPPQASNDTLPVIDVGDSSVGRKVDIEVFQRAPPENTGFYLVATLKNIALPIEFDRMEHILSQLGHTSLSSMIVCREEHVLTITDGPSNFIPGKGGEINLDQPLLHYYHKCFKSAIDSDTGSSQSRSEAQIYPYNVSPAELRGGSLILNGAEISFRRTVRVPDNEMSHSLPPDLGAFTIYNVADYAERLPESIVEKGGIFITMYQREAMWLSFCTNFNYQREKGSAVKVSVGGVNALTGCPRDERAPKGKQDYLAVNGMTGQIWLDGISVSPGVVRQFLAMEMGKGYTVEGQVTGREDVGGMQIDVFKQLPDTMCFLASSVKADYYKTPRELGMKKKDKISMYDKLQKASKLSRSSGVLKFVHANGSRMRIIIEHSQPPSNQQNDDVLSRPLSLLSELDHDSLPFQDYSALMHLRGTSASIFGFDPIRRSFRIDRGVSEGFAAGGKISQKINRDTLPVIVYDTDPERVHITIINAEHFSGITGLPLPPSPISPQTYLNLGYSWFSLYDEHIPHANNTTVCSILSQVKSIASVDAERHNNVVPGTVQQPCCYCSYQMATYTLVPCTHAICDDCADGLAAHVCPGCDVRVEQRKRFAAPMAMPGREANDGVAANSSDPRVQLLKIYGGGSKVATFKLKEHTVSGLHGECSEITQRPTIV